MHITKRISTVYEMTVSQKILNTLSCDEGALPVLEIRICRELAEKLWVSGMADLGLMAGNLMKETPISVYICTCLYPVNMMFWVSKKNMLFEALACAAGGCQMRTSATRGSKLTAASR